MDADRPQFEDDSAEEAAKKPHVAPDLDATEQTQDAVPPTTEDAGSNEHAEEAGEFDDADHLGDPADASVPEPPEELPEGPADSERAADLSGDDTENVLVDDALPPSEEIETTAALPGLLSETEPMHVAGTEADPVSPEPPAAKVVTSGDGPVQRLVADMFKPAPLVWSGNSIVPPQPAVPGMGIGIDDGSIPSPSVPPAAGTEGATSGKGVVGDFLLRPGDRPEIRLLPHIPGQDSSDHVVQLLASPNDNARDADMPGPAAPAPQADSPEPLPGLPLGLPVMLRGTDPLVQQAIDAAAETLAKTVDEQAQWLINDRERKRAAELRAIDGPSWCNR